MLRSTHRNEINARLMSGMGRKRSLAFGVNSTPALVPAPRPRAFGAGFDAPSAPLSAGVAALTRFDAPNALSYGGENAAIGPKAFGSSWPKVDGRLAAVIGGKRTLRLTP
jgi:hypothetical protein